MNSARLPTGADGFTTSMRPADVSWVIGVKLSTGWYGSFGFSAALTVCWW
jgi:hypothetical protein